MKKGRHRRYEEARAVKHTVIDIRLDDEGFQPEIEPCPECGAGPGAPHAAWCLHEEALDEEDSEGEDGSKLPGD